MLLSGPEVKSTFQPVNSFFFAYFFGHSIWLRAREHCTSVPWLCECWRSHTWECFKSPDTPFGDVPCGTLGMFPVAGRMPSILQSILIQNGAKGGIRGLKALPSVTAPALVKPWHASAMLPSPQPNAVAEEICGKKKNCSQAEKCFSPRDRIEALQLRPTNQKKLFSL